ncbi:MAG: sulfatase [Opitutales bacterium]|nr:sulfatase [Opitutales bacterium]
MLFQKSHRIPFFLIFVALSFSCTSFAESTKPNILFFLIDDQRDTALGCYGDPLAKTPAVDQLAENGVLFQNAFVTTSICMASRASFFTGQVTRSHGVPYYRTPLSDEKTHTVYPILLRKAGYRVGYVGKFHFQVDGSNTPDKWFDFYHKISRPLIRKKPDGSTHHGTAELQEKVYGFLNKQTKDQPFCLSISFHAAHAEDPNHEPGQGHFPYLNEFADSYTDVDFPEPRLSDPKIYESQPEFLKESLNRVRYFWRWDTPKKYQANIKAYYQMIRGIDQTIGKAMKILEERGLADNTIIIYMADNGFYMGDRGFAGKWSHYEESLRVPLIIMDPRNSAVAGSRIEQLTLNTDIPSTILDWAGIEIPKKYQGESLLPLLDGQNIQLRESIFCESLYPPNVIPKWEGVRNSRYVYARYFEQDPVYEFLHDLKKDPDQLRNFASDPNYAKVLNDLRTECDQYIAQYEAAR